MSSLSLWSSSLAAFFTFLARLCSSQFLWPFIGPSLLFWSSGVLLLVERCVFIYYCGYQGLCGWCWQADVLAVLLTPPGGGLGNEVISAGSVPIHKRTFYHRSEWKFNLTAGQRHQWDCMGRQGRAIVWQWRLTHDQFILRCLWYHWPKLFLGRIIDIAMGNKQTNKRCTSIIVNIVIDLCYPITIVGLWPEMKPEIKTEVVGDWLTERRKR